MSAGRGFTCMCALIDKEPDECAGRGFTCMCALIDKASDECLLGVVSPVCVP